MVDNKNIQEDNQKGVPAPEKKISATEPAAHFGQEVEKNLEKKKEISPYDKIVSDELKREIEMMELDDKAKIEVEKKVEKIGFLGEKEKIEHLLEIAKEKGVIFAIKVAKKMNEPYLLDTLHDILAREGFYIKFSKPSDDDNDK